MRSTQTEFMSDFQELEAFVALVEQHSASKAAEKLGVATSAVSRRVKALESRLGVQLAKRTTRSMTLTEDGRLFYSRSKQLLEDKTDAENEVMRSSAALSGRLSVTAPLSFGVQSLTPLVASFLIKHPKLDLNLDLSDRRADLVEEGFDLAFRIGTLEDSSLVAKKICNIEHVVYCSASFLEQHGPIQTPADLSQLPALCYSNAKQPALWAFLNSETLEPEQVKVTAKISAPNGEALRELAVAGLGVGCQPKFIVERALESGELVQVLDQWVWSPMSLYALYPKTRHLSLRVRAFIDHVLAHYAP